MTSPHKLWPPEITKSSAVQYNRTCPYILSQKVLGTGSYSHVYECKSIETGAHYAAKQYSKKLVYGMELMLQSEFQVLKAVLNGHTNILLMVDYFETSEYFYLVTDLASGGELFEKITTSPQRKLSVAETIKVLRPLLSALEHLHSNNVVHRDVKAENILFSSRNARDNLLVLADFGHARIMADGETEASCSGTLSYLAPEVISRTGASFPVDMWAVGVLTYFMLCGYMPFDCDSDDETKKLILAADYVYEPPEYWADIPVEAKRFIGRCFEVDPQRRITASEAQNDAFLTGATLTPSASQGSFQKLHEAVWKLHRNRSMSGLLNRLMESDTLCSRLSLEMHPHTLHGERCCSPEMVSALSSPASSAAVSRTQSLSSIHRLSGMKMTQSASIRTGKARFVI